MKPIMLKGIVKKFSGQGRKLGYPTANIEIPEETAEGLFLGLTELRGSWRASIIFIGAPITLGETQKRAESHILDFPDEDLYGEQIKIKIEKKLRDNRKFGSKQALIQQMRKDEEAARRYFKG